jgi:hypothetical protein
VVQVIRRWINASRSGRNVVRSREAREDSQVISTSALPASRNANSSVNPGRSFFAYRLADRSLSVNTRTTVHPLPVATVRHSASCSPTDRFPAPRSCDTLV